MKAHRSLTRREVLQKGSSQIALMIASEFGRACSRASHQNNVLACYARARELMGILETTSMPRDVALHLKPIYARLTERELLLEKRLTPAFIERSCSEFAAEFTKASDRLGRI